MALRSNQQRYIIVYCLILVLFIPIYYRLAHLQFFGRARLLSLADKQHNLVVELPSKRGYIFDAKQKELAISLKVPSVYAVSRLVYDKEGMAQRLADILQLDYDYIHDRLTRDKSFVWIKRKISEEAAEKIKLLKDPNINILYETKRFYPNNEALAHILGFCNIDNQGLEGIELMLDEYLRGRPGFQYTKRDARGRKLVAMEEKYIPPVHGCDVILTVDNTIQHIVERELDDAFKKWKAKGAIALVLDCRTGRILGIANRPTYNLNAYSGTPLDMRRNRAVTDIFEPGSIFKIVTGAAALQEKVITATDEFYCENGEFHVSRSRVLHDVHPYGTLDFPNVLIKSSNIGTVKIALKLGEAKLYEYIKLFGFGSLTGVDLPGEIPGIVHHPRNWSKISITSVPIGQEVAGTALQMITAMSVIANGGSLVTPYIVEEIRDSQGVIIKKNSPRIKRTFIDQSVSSTISAILTRVVDEGTGKSAKIEGIPVAGKTGTAQKILPNGKGYSHSDFVGSFMGFVPSNDPMLSIIVVIDEPRPLYYGGTVAAPVFKNIAEKALNYLGYVRPQVEAPRTEDETAKKESTH